MMICGHDNNEAMVAHLLLWCDDRDGGIVMVLIIMIMMMDGRCYWSNDAIALNFFNFSYYILNVKCSLQRNWRTVCVLLLCVQYIQDGWMQNVCVGNLDVSLQKQLYRPLRDSCRSQSYHNPSRYQLWDLKLHYVFSPVKCQSQHGVGANDSKCPCFFHDTQPVA